MKLKLRSREQKTGLGKAKKLCIAGGVLAAVLAGSAVIMPLLPPQYAEEATAEAQETIAATYVSKACLKDTLTDRYSPEAAEYALEQVEDTDWNQEALEALDHLDKTSDLSEKKLRSLLEEEEFESSEIGYAFRQRDDDLDFGAHAVTALTAYTPAGILNRPAARTWLQEELFEEDQVARALESDAVDWKESAKSEAVLLLASPISEKTYRSEMEKSEYTEDEIGQALKAASPDFETLCLEFLKKNDEHERYSESKLRSMASGAKFTEAQISKAIEKRGSDWNYNAVRYAGYLCDTFSQKFTKETLAGKLTDAGFSKEQTDFVLKYFDETAGTVDDEQTIRTKIKEEEKKKAEEEARRKAEEEARKKAEEEARKKAEEEARQKAEEEARKQAQAQAEAQRQAELEAQKQQQAAAVVPNSSMVWIPNSGTKYHSYAGCSNMKNPSQVTLDQAQASGYGRCKKCW